MKVGITGYIGERGVVFSAAGGDARASIFHRASWVGGECEEQFDDALRVNLVGVGVDPDVRDESGLLGDGFAANALSTDTWVG